MNTGAKFSSLFNQEAVDPNNSTLTRSNTEGSPTQGKGDSTGLTSIKYRCPELCASERLGFHIHSQKPRKTENHTIKKKKKIITFPTNVNS